MQAMVDQDHRIEDIVSNIRIMQGKGETQSQTWRNAMSEYAEKISFYDLPTKIDKTHFINTLYTKTLEAIGKSWDFWFGLTLRYKEQFADPNAPALYKTPEGYRLGQWQDTQRQFYKNQKLLAEKIKQLEDAGFTWSVLDEIFEKGFRETLRYKEQFGDPNAPALYKTPEGYKLGIWQHVRRRTYRLGKITSDKIKRLEEIGFKWVIQKELLEKAFEVGFHETLRYKKKFGDPNTPKDYKTPAGYGLGSWQYWQRYLYKKRNLSSDKINRLEGIGFKWVSREACFIKGFQETLRYKDQFGFPNAPLDYKTPEGYKLGTWQSRIRSRKNKLTPNKIEMLEETGFTWAPHDITFEHGFRETLKYKEQFGDSNAPALYKTYEGYRLGKWQSHIRRSYKKRKLSLERIKRLEEIGFRWKLKNIKRLKKHVAN
jgi:hypothetical protein